MEQGKCKNISNKAEVIPTDFSIETVNKTSNTKYWCRRKRSGACGARVGGKID